MAILCINRLVSYKKKKKTLHGEEWVNHTVAMHKLFNNIVFVRLSMIKLTKKKKKPKKLK